MTASPFAEQNNAAILMGMDFKAAEIAIMSFSGEPVGDIGPLPGRRNEAETRQARCAIPAAAIEKARSRFFIASSHLRGIESAQKRRVSQVSIALERLANFSYVMIFTAESNTNPHTHKM